MKRKVKQFFYKNSVDNNVTRESLENGDAFNKYLPIVQLGVQSIPGVKFKINNGTDYVTIGSTGIFELQMPVGVYISSLMFNDNNSWTMIEGNKSEHLIVDIVYESEEEE